jgi:UDP-N-acetyl-D-glucosamine dehydrogenase
MEKGYDEILRGKLDAHKAVVGVVGQGYVGLPLALAFSKKGFHVLGFDVDESKIAALKEGRSYIKHIPADGIREQVRSGRFQPLSDFARMGEADAVLICVPTPLTPQREPDMSYVVSTTHQVAKTLRPGQLVILESTTYPGTTDELMLDILEKTGLVCGKDLFLAFSPEREDPGNKDFQVHNTPKVVGGVDAVSGDLAEQLYKIIVDKVVRVSSARAAEASKLTENIYRAVNIALVNELKIVYDRMGIDIWEVLDAAATKPFGFKRFNPGPGWGGHCIPLDPFYLTWKAREYGVSTQFIEHAGEVNVRMPEYVAEKLTLALNDRRKPVKGSKILVLGAAYKKDIDDIRESPFFEVVKKLQELDAEVTYHDPYIPKIPRTRQWPHLSDMMSVPLTEDALKGCDAVVLVTDHAEVDYAFVAQHAPLIVDTRGVYRGKRDNVVKA